MIIILQTKSMKLIENWLKSKQQKLYWKMSIWIFHEIYVFNENRPWLLQKCKIQKLFFTFIFYVVDYMICRIFFHFWVWPFWEFNKEWRGCVIIKNYQNCIFEGTLLNTFFRTSFEDSKMVWQSKIGWKMAEWHCFIGCHFWKWKKLVLSLIF